MFPATRSRLGSITALAVGTTLTVLSEPIHRGSLSNARDALEERRSQDRAAAVGLQQFADRVPRASAAENRGTDKRQSSAS